jgi:hypothetical protein
MREVFDARDEARAKAPKDKSGLKYKDTLMRMLFKDPERAVELVNAITGSNYTEDNHVVMCDLGYSLLKRYNDLAFVVDNQLLFMIEHQSSINPNMPLRFLSYMTDVLYTWFVKVDKLYGKKLHPIPVPKFYVLYNGVEPLKEKTLKLSDAFYIKGEPVSLEVMVEIVDVNYASGHKVLERSESLRGYAYLVEQIRCCMARGMTRDQAIRESIDLCIQEGVLVEFLQRYYAEVAKMLRWEYDQEAEFRVLRQEAREEGKEEGIKQNKLEIAKNALKGGLTIQTISSITGLNEKAIRALV